MLCPLKASIPWQLPFVAHILASSRAGFNDASQLGDGSSTARLTPVPVSIVGNSAAATFLAAGESHSCVVINYGSEAAMCWG